MNRGTVDFCIATEGEMKKVNWTTRREIFGSTWVVIVLALSTAMFLFLADLIFRELFTLLGVLVGESVIMESIRGLFDSGAGA
ncbi:MAG: preprotein translocase subunit SecE [Planctomycetes bacterium]|nr:preprotein translocase subunit SecE [Planctomycetota bacterium]NOG54167.1 preprotein translocase subunit SecE [Planctomycetota bacterium]